MSKFTFIDLFCGIGGFRTALDRLGGECVFSSEIDKYAAQAYGILYGEEPSGDITKIDAAAVPDHDILVGGFPCQAFSVAGRGLGFEDTRGTLFFEIARIAKEKQPKIILMENVKGLVSHDQGRTLETIVRTLNQIGYAVDLKILNSKHFGVPQNRERIFFVCVRTEERESWILPKKMDVLDRFKQRIMREWAYVHSFNFDWPTNNTVDTRLIDILEDAAAESFYIPQEKADKLLAQLGENVLGPIIIDTRQHIDGDRFYENIVPTINATEYKEPKLVAHHVDDINMIGHLEDISGHDICKRVYGVDGVSPTIPTGSSGNTTPKIAVQMNQHEITKKCELSHTIQARDSKGYSNRQYMTGIVEAPQEVSKEGVGISYALDASYHKGFGATLGRGRRTHIATTQVRPVLTPDRVEKAQNGRRFKEDGEEMFTLTVQDVHGVAVESDSKWRIRKLTPLECFRLQAFPDDYYHKLTAAKISNTQLYKMAGNAVTVNVIESIGRRLVNYL